jgi:hypothetical protein
MRAACIRIMNLHLVFAYDSSVCLQCGPVQELHALIETLLCVLRGLKSPSSPTVIDKIEEDISRLFRQLCKLSIFAKTSVNKPKWLDLFNYVTYVLTLYLVGNKVPTQVF